MCRRNGGKVGNKEDMEDRIGNIMVSWMILQEKSIQEENKSWKKQGIENLDNHNVFLGDGSKEAKRKRKDLRLKNSRESKGYFAGNQVMGRCASLMGVRTCEVDGRTLNLLTIGYCRSKF